MPSQNNTKHIIGARGQANTTRQKSLARLDQITGTCVDQLFWNKEPPPPPTMLETGNDEFITINNIELGGGGRTDKFP